jgi:nucleoside-diphosphate kinase
MSKDIIQRTLVFIKPDGVKRGLVGEIIHRFERAGLKIVGLKMMWLPKEFAKEHYRDTPKWREKIKKNIVEAYESYGLTPPQDLDAAVDKIIDDIRAYVTSGPIVAMVLEGPRAVYIVRKLVGDTSPERAAPGTIRGDYSIDSYPFANVELRAIRNVVHASDAENAEREIKLFFKEEEIFDYKRADEHIMFEPL